ncbi:MAG TPA: hypothetical protein VIK92_03855 [Thermaerobacter sp.]
MTDRERGQEPAARPQDGTKPQDAAGNTVTGDAGQDGGRGDGSLLLVPPPRRRRQGQAAGRGTARPGERAAILAGRIRGFLEAAAETVRAGFGSTRARVTAAAAKARERLVRWRARMGRGTPAGAGAAATAGHARAWLGRWRARAGRGTRLGSREAAAVPVTAGPVEPGAEPGAGMAGPEAAPAAVAGEALAGADPAPFGWFLLTVVYLLTAIYSALPAPGEGLFGAALAGGSRMAAWLVVAPYLFAGLYTGVTGAGRGWVYPLTFTFWPLIIERGLLYLFGMAGQWMQVGFPAGWREAMDLQAALAFTRETLAPYATPVYVALAPAGLAIAMVTWWVTGRLRNAVLARWGGPGVPSGLRRRFTRGVPPAGAGGGWPAGAGPSARP